MVDLPQKKNMPWVRVHKLLSNYTIKFGKKHINPLPPK